MNNEKWEETKELVKKNFKSVKNYKQDLLHTNENGQEVVGVQEILEFENPAGRFKLVRESKPMVLEKKELFSNRAGQSAQVQYKFSETEFSHKLKVFKEVDFDEWEEMTLESMGF